MIAITGIFSNFIRKIRGELDTKFNYVFYKIVDSYEENQKYLLQCINTKATFSSTITEIVFDIDILHRLHPVQACYIGIEYSRYIKNTNPTPETQKAQEEKTYRSSICRYGKYKLCSQNRAGEIQFTNLNNNKKFVMDPRDIALSKELINEFDAAQAFYIGLLAGFQINNPIKKNNKSIKKPILKLVK